MLYNFLGLLTILFWCLREKIGEMSGDERCFSITSKLEAPELDSCPQFVCLSLASQEIGHMSNPTITCITEHKERHRLHQINVHKYELFAFSKSQVNCCRTNDSFPQPQKNKHKITKTSSNVEFSKTRLEAKLLTLRIGVKALVLKRLTCL